MEKLQCFVFLFANLLAIKKNNYIKKFKKLEIYNTKTYKKGIFYEKFSA